MWFQGVGTKIEPTLCRADRLVGQILGSVGALPQIFIELEISYYLLKRLLGVRTEGDKKGARVSFTCSILHNLKDLHYRILKLTYISVNNTIFFSQTLKVLKL